MGFTRLIATLTVTTTSCLGLSAASAAPAVQTGPLSPSSVSTEADTHENIILQRVNHLRASLGLSPVIRVQELDDIAQNWSEHMAYAGAISHRPKFQDYYPQGWRGASENIASRQYESEPDIGNKLYEQWQDSPGHYANMVDPQTNTIGIGLTYDATNDTWYGTQNFAIYPDVSKLSIAAASVSTSTSNLGDASEDAQPAPTSTPGPQLVSPEHSPAIDPTPAAQESPVTVEVTPDVSVEENPATPTPQTVAAVTEEPKTESVTHESGSAAPIKEVSEPEISVKAAVHAPSKQTLPETGLETWIPGSVAMTLLMGGCFLAFKRRHARR